MMLQVFSNMIFKKKKTIQWHGINVYIKKLNLMC